MKKMFDNTETLLAHHFEMIRSLPTSAFAVFRCPFARTKHVALGIELHTIFSSTLVCFSATHFARVVLNFPALTNTQVAVSLYD